MAENEDPKDKVVTAAAPKTAVAPAVDTPVAKATSPVKPAEAKPEPKLIEVKVAETKPVEIKAPEPKPVEAKPVAKVSEPEPVPAKAKPTVKAPVAKGSVAKAADIKAKPAPKPVVATAPVVKTKPVAAPAAPVVPVKAPAPAPVVKATKDEGKAAPAVSSPKAAAPKAASKTASNEKPVFAGLFTNFMLEETKMDMSANFTGLQDAFTEAQAKAKAAFEKSSSMLGEVSEFAKGNAEAVVESGKIFAEGVQGLGSELVAEGRTAFETITGDIKELAAAKSPTDFFKIQGDVVRKNFDSAVAYSSKNSEAMLKLMSDVFAPISGRVSIAMEKARSASL